MQSRLLWAPVFLAGVMMTLPAHAGIYGDTLTSSGSYGSFAISPGTTTAGLGPEFEFTVDSAPAISFDFTPTDLVLTTSSIDIGFSVPLSFTDLSTAFTMAALSSTDVSGFNASDVSFADGTVTVEVGNNIAFGAGETVDIALTPSVPEPSRYGFAVFLTFLAFLGWRRFSSRAA